MVPLPNLINSKPQSTSISNTNVVKEGEITEPFQSYASNELITSEIITSSHIFPFSMESQDLLMTRANEPISFIDGFGPLDHIASEFPIGFPHFEPLGSSNPTNPDSFFDDFPTDMFDEIDQPPSPSEL